MKLDPVAKAQHFLQTVAFCLAIAALHVAFLPDKPWGPPLAYSMSIGIVTWAVIDLGRHAFPSARETGWPAMVPGVLLVACGILLGFLVGTTLGHQLSMGLDLYGDLPPASRQSDLRTSALITVIAGVVGTYWFYSRSKGAYLEGKMAEAQRHANEARLKLLEAQLEPHMLFNTLANLRALIGVDPQQAQRMLDHMIAFLRATLDASREATHPLEREFARLSDYLELMSIRMGPRLAHELHLPPALAGQPVPTLLLQPLVENAIRHGLEPQVEGGRLRVSARADGGELVLEVLDTGIGPGTPAPGGGFGLAHVRERLATVYGSRARLEFGMAEPRGTRAAIHLPLSA